jgi:hypothetical protein
MKKIIILFLLVIALPLALVGCKPGQSLTVTPQLSSSASISPTITLASPAVTPPPQGETILVTSLEDGGPGTLRQALLDAQPGDVVAFDPALFPPEADSQPLILQSGNYSPVTLLVNKPSSELDDNRIGDVAETQHVGPRVWNGGAKWMRVIVDAAGEWQHVDWESGEYNIDPDEDKAIDDLVSNGVRVMIVLDVWYPDHRTVYYKSEEDLALYLNWVRFMVQHFKGRVEYYEILNEPDLNFSAPSGMPVDKYAHLVERTVPVIREEDPAAKIVVGAVPDTRFNDARDWIWGLLNSGVMPLVDGFSWHGMYGAAPSDDPRGVRDPDNPQMENYWENYPAFVEQIKSVAASNGFNGEFLTEEMLWRTSTHPHESEPYGFTDMSAAKYYARAIIIHLGLDVSPGLAIIPEDERPISYAIIRSLANIMAGTNPTQLPVVVESEANNLRYYTFTYSNGDRLLAIWTDGAAAEDDSAVSATLMVPNFSSGEVVGFDVLYGFEQQIQVSNENGDLMVPDLQVKDYPLILLFKDLSSF